MHRTPSPTYLLDNAVLWIEEYLDILDVPVELASVRWDRRYRKRIASAEIDDDVGLVRLSTHLYPRLRPDRRLEVLAHEACHLATWSLHGSVADEHGPEWKELMRRLGFNDAGAFMKVD